MALRVFQTLRNISPACWLIGSDHTLFLRLNGERHTEVGNISYRACLLSDQLRKRLAGILVVWRDRDTCARLNGFNLTCPICPFRRAVVANGVLRERASTNETHCQQGGKSESFQGFTHQDSNG